MNRGKEYYFESGKNPYVFPISGRLFQLDPLASPKSVDLLEESIDLLFNVGIEGLNLHMLAERLGVPLSYVHKYFQDKFRLTAYLNEFYWHWLSHWISRFQLRTTSAKHRLIISIQCLCHEYTPLQEIQEPFIYPLYISLIREPLKQDAFFTEGLIDLEYNRGYRKLALIFKDTIEELNPDYPYAYSFASTIIESFKHYSYAIQFMNEPNLADSSRVSRYSNYLIDMAMNVLIEK